MANKGRNTNTSQLYALRLYLTYDSFITYRPVPHLDRKHTVFGKVVGGLEILDKLEDIPTDHDEKPQQDIKINNIIIFVDPFDVTFVCIFSDLQEWQKKRRDKEDVDLQDEEDAKKLKDDDVMTWTGKKVGNFDKKPGHLTAAVKRSTTEDALAVDTFEVQEPVKKKPKAGGFGNFSGW